MRSAQPVLANDRYLLRAPTAADSAQIVQACQDPDIAGFTQVPDPYTEADALWFIADAADGWERGTKAEFVVLDAAAALVGTCGIVSLNIEQSVGELGYWVAPWARGQGVASDALRVLTQWAHGELGLQRLKLHIEPVNRASQAVAVAAGYRLSDETLELELKATIRQFLVYHHWAD